MITEALTMMKSFVEVAKEITKIPDLAIPKYQACARDLYEICQRLSQTNEDLARWIYRFSYFDFRSNDARAVRSDFLIAVKEYRTMRSGDESRKLHFHCSDIEKIYHRNIESGIKEWFASESKLQQIKDIFNKLTACDSEMVEFVTNNVWSLIDKAITELEGVVDCAEPDIQKAEKIRFVLKAELSNITPTLETFNNEISKLTMAFAKIADVPLTFTATP